MRLGTRSIVAAASLALLAGNLGRLPFIEIGGRSGAIGLLDLVLLPLWLLLALKIPGGARRWRLDGVSLAALAFIGIATVGTLAAGPKWGLGVGQWAGSAAFLVRWVLYAGFFLLVVSDPDAPQVSRESWRRIEQVVMAIALFGFVQVLLLPGFGTMVSEITGVPADPQGRRLVSTLLDPQFAGGLFAVVLLVQVAIYAEGLPRPTWPMAVLAAALALTVSRSAVLGTAAGLGVILLVRGFTPALRRLGLIGALLALPLLPPLLVFAMQFNKLQVDGSALQRLIPWLRGAQMLLDNPLFGVGFNAAAAAQRAYGWVPIGGSDVSMDGGLLFIAVMTGLLGLTAFLAMLGALAVIARRSWRSPMQDAESRGFAVGAVAATVAVVVQSFFTSTLLLPWVMVPLWLAWARVVAQAPARGRVAARGRPAPSGPGLGLRPLQPLLVLPLLMVLGGCDPCAGVAECSRAPARVATGTIISRVSDAPVEGVVVEASGRQATTNAAGRWRLELPASDSVVTVNVRAGADSYDVRNVRLREVRTTGDGTELGVWFDRPRIGYVMAVRDNGSLLRNAQVRFTADAAFGGFVLNVNSGASGYFRFSGEAPVAGPITGTLRVVHPTSGTWVFPGATIESDYALIVEPIRKEFEMRRRFEYGGNVVHRGTFEHSPGSTLRFTRTGGLTLLQDPVTVTAGAQGFFIIGIQPRGRGEIIGNLRVTPPGGGAPYTYTGYRFTTYDSTNVRYIGLFAHGERWDWVFELRRSGSNTPIANTPFEFQRTGGLAIEPSDLIGGRSNGSGRLLVRASVRDTGTVTGILRMLPAGSPPITVGTFSLRTFAADTQNFAGVYQIPLP
jgi:O-antigen ligase